MPPFVKFILLIIVLAMCGTLGVVAYTEHHIKTWQIKNAARERAGVDAMFARINKKFRRADMTVISQTVGGDKKVLATTLMLQPWGIDEGGSSSIPLTPQIVTINGGSPVIVIRSIKFPDDFKFDDDDVSNYSGIVAGKTIYLFDQVHAANVDSQGFWNAKSAEVPVYCQVDPTVRPFGFENSLWHKIWMLAKGPTEALRGGLHEETFESLPTEVRPGMVYQVWIEGDERPSVREQDDPKEVAAMLNAVSQTPSPPGQ